MKINVDIISNHCSHDERVKTILKECYFELISENVILVVVMVLMMKMMLTVMIMTATMRMWDSNI